MHCFNMPTSHNSTSQIYFLQNIFLVNVVSRIQAIGYYFGKKKFHLLVSNLRQISEVSKTRNDTKS